MGLFSGVAACLVAGAKTAGQVLNPLASLYWESSTAAVCETSDPRRSLP